MYELSWHLTAAYWKVYAATGRTGTKAYGHAWRSWLLGPLETSQVENRRNEMLTREEMEAQILGLLARLIIRTA